MHQRLGKGGSKGSGENWQFVLSKRNPWAISPKVKSFHRFFLLKDLIITKRSLEFPFSLGQPVGHTAQHNLRETPIKLSGITGKSYTVQPKPNFNIKMKWAGGNSLYG